MKRLHDRWRSGPAVATNHAFYCFECSQMLLCVEAIAARTPLCLRDQAIRLVIAYLLNTDVSSLARYLKQQGVLEAINERVRFARRRFGRYEVIDFLVVLFGYAISGERTLEAFYERLSRASHSPPLMSSNSICIA